MYTVTLQVSSREEINKRFLAAFGGEAQGTVISFATPELLWQVLTAKRWELLKALCGAGPVSIREAARRAGRDVKAVHGEVQVLLKAGILQKTEKGQIVFPYDNVRVNFMLHAA